MSSTYSSIYIHVFVTYFAFKSSEIKYYLKKLDSNGSSDSDNMFPIFLKNADLVSSKLPSGNFP